MTLRKLHGLACRLLARLGIRETLPARAAMLPTIYLPAEMASRLLDTMTTRSGASRHASSLAPCACGA
jgi:hypothetical protein